jgi:predicted ATPase
MKKFLLVVFGDYLQDSESINYLKNFAISLTPLVDTPQIKFQFSKGASIFHFGTEVPMEEINYYIKSCIESDGVGMSFILTEMNDKVSVSFPQVTYEHLMDLESDNSSEIRLSQNTAQTQFEEEDESQYENLASLLELIKNDKKPSLDSILDKIKDKGIDSLTNYEKDVLSEYSKK